MLVFLKLFWGGPPEPLFLLEEPYLSPSFKVVTPRPTAATVPAPSWPITMGAVTTNWPMRPCHAREWRVGGPTEAVGCNL